MKNNAVRKVGTFSGKEIHFRSTAEYRYALTLQLRLIAGDIREWQYEPRFFEFPVKHGTTRYKPDFLIIEKDGSETWVEIKGYLQPKDRTKMNRMKKYYPDVRLHLLSSKDFTNIQLN